MTFVMDHIDAVWSVEDSYATPRKGQLAREQNI
jgi:hypothetical protein